MRSIKPLGVEVEDTVAVERFIQLPAPISIGRSLRTGSSSRASGEYVSTTPQKREDVPISERRNTRPAKGCWKYYPHS